MTCLRKHRGEVEVQFEYIHTQKVEGGGWSKPRIGIFGPGRDPYTFYRRMGGIHVM
jgi:hypothetical protein